MTQKTVVTHTARQTEIAASPDSWVTNKACVKILCPQKIVFPNTGRFIMYSGITKICYRKTVGHVFTKPVQIKGTTQKNFFPSNLFFIEVPNFCR